MSVHAIVSSSFLLPLVTGFLTDVGQYFVQNQAELLMHASDHATIVIRALVVAIPLGITLGTVITYNDRLAMVVIWLAGIMMTIPSVALFALLLPSLGTGSPPVVVALILYTQLPVIRNTYVGLTGVDEAAVEAGRGLGMTRRQSLLKIQIPMALPVVMSGIRNAVVLLVGIAAIGEIVGAGGLGVPIFDGYRGSNSVEIVAATITLAGLTVLIDYALGVFEQLLRLRNGEDIQPSFGTRVVYALGRLAPARLTDRNGHDHGTGTRVRQ